MHGLEEWPSLSFGGAQNPAYRPSGNAALRAIRLALQGRVASGVIEMTMHGLGAMAILLSLPMAAMAQDAAAPATAPLTVQQMFDSASEAAVKGDHARALALLTTLEQRVKNPRSLAIVRLRRAIMLTLMSRWEEARPLLAQAVVALPEGDSSLDADRADALDALGRLAQADLDYDAARLYFARAAVLTTDPAAKVGSLLREAQAGVFVDPAQALTKLEEADRMILAQPDKSKAVKAQATAVRGRALLNLGRFAEAQAAFARTVSAEGGLTMTVNYDDLVARSDAAIAAMLAGNRDRARNYLVYTGAGRMPTQDFTAGADMGLPICGEDGIRPEDVAVVEFGIADNGAVSYARPVYGSRPGGMALVFARAVMRWSWRPEDLAKIPALFRFVTRLELRCSTGEGGPSPVFGPQRAFRQWLDQQGAPHFEPQGESEARRRVALEGELARLRAMPNGQPVAEAEVLADILESPLSTKEQAEKYGPPLLSILASQSAPPLARLWVDWLIHRTQWDYLVEEGPYASDPVARATVLLMNYDRLPAKQKPQSQAVLDRVIADPALGKDHPLRVAALTRRASAKAAAQDLTGARADFLATGLTDQQCSIVDAKPSLESARTFGNDYPTDMVNVGVEGWTRVQFDIAADGHTLNQRAIITYPPMIFGANGQKIVARAKYAQSYRPDGGLGCGGSAEMIRFKMPD